LQKFSQIPNPFVVEPPPWGERHYAPCETLAFGFVLIGRAGAHLPLIVHAWQHAFQQGVGAGDGRAALAGIHHEGQAILEAGALIAHDAVVPGPGDVPRERLTLRFDTSLRLQVNGKPLSAAELTAPKLLSVWSSASP